jgi:hypothetical protein
MDPAVPVGWATVVLPEWRRRSGGQVIEPRLYLPLFMSATETEVADRKSKGWIGARKKKDVAAGV